jgi:hypothetical protein
MDRLARFAVLGGDLFVVEAVILYDGELISWAVIRRSLSNDHVFCNIIRMLQRYVRFK